MSKTQFLIVIAINILLFGTLFGHIFNENVRTEFKEVPKLVYKDRIVKNCTNTVTKIQNVTREVCSATDNTIRMMQSASTICQDNSSNRLKNFKIDNSGKPVFNCD